MNSARRYQLGAVFLIEVLKIRQVLEVVGVDLAVVYNVVGDNVVGELPNFKGNSLLCEDLLCNRKDLCVRSGRSGNGDLGAVQSRVINGGIVAIAGILNNGNNCSAVLGGDKVGNLLGGESGNESLYLIGILVSFLNCNDVGVSGSGTSDARDFSTGLMPAAIA